MYLVRKGRTVSDEANTINVDVQKKFNELVQLFNTLGKLKGNDLLSDEHHEIIVPLWQRTEAFIQRSGENVQIFMKLFEESEPILKKILEHYEQSGTNISE